ncbi:MAG: fibronectin type III domain-containing protein [Mogibacterium sp.]|nr:fibronectin type III domain-containing protein [Mogibacterium sp.]
MNGIIYYRNRLVSHITAVLLTAAVFLSAMPWGITAYAASNSNYVYFGRYYQNRVTDEYEYDAIRTQKDFFKDGKATISGVKIIQKGNEYYKEAPIRWKIISCSGSNYVLISEKVLEMRDFGYMGAWEDSKMRSWLNNEFFNTAFTAVEQEKILPANVTVVNQTYDQWRLRQDGHEETTIDKVWLLYDEEVQGGSYGFTDDQSRVAYATDYVDTSGGAVQWWLRGYSGWSYGNRQNTYVNAEGALKGWYQTYSKGVRPVISVRKEAVSLSCPEETKISGKYRITVEYPQDDKICSYPCYYSDEFFRNSALDESKDMALLSVLGAASTYTNGDSTNYAEKMLYQCGFRVNSYNYTFSKDGESSTANSGHSTFTESKKYNENNDYDHCRVQIAYKNIPARSPEFTVIAVFINGYTAGGYEWLSNFNLGQGATHKGFSNAERELKKVVDNYIEDNKEYFSDNIKFWITGHSRGGAITDMLALDLSQNGGYKDENIFAYGFATPAYSKKKTYKKNIRNYIVSGDFVPKVAPVDWGFYRNNPNQDYVLYESTKMRNKFKEITGKPFTGFSNQDGRGSDELYRKFLSFAKSQKGFEKKKKYTSIRFKNKITVSVSKSLPIKITTYTPLIATPHKFTGSPREYCQLGMGRALTEQALSGVGTLLEYAMVDKKASAVTEILLKEGGSIKIGSLKKKVLDRNTVLYTRFNDSHCISAYIAGVATDSRKRVLFPSLGKISKKTKLKAGSKKISVKWTKAKNAQGYEIQYATKKDMSDAKIKEIQGGSKQSYNIKKLKKGKKYYVRIRSYTKVGEAKYYSEWTKIAGPIKTK